MDDMERHCLIIKKRETCSYCRLLYVYTYTYIYFVYVYSTCLNKS